MSHSLLYLAFGIRGYHLAATRFEEGSVIFRIKRSMTPNIRRSLNTKELPKLGKTRFESQGYLGHWIDSVPQQQIAA